MLLVMKKAAIFAFIASLLVQSRIDAKLIPDEKSKLSVEISQFKAGESYTLFPQSDYPLYFFIDLSAISEYLRASARNDSDGMLEEIKLARRAYQISGGKLKFKVLSMQNSLMEVRIIDSFKSSLYTDPRPYRSTLDFQRGFLFIRQAQAISQQNFKSGRLPERLSKSPFSMPNPFAAPMSLPKDKNPNPININKNKSGSKLPVTANPEETNLLRNQVQQLESQLTNTKLEKKRIADNFTKNRLVLDKALEENKLLTNELERIKKTDIATQREPEDESLSRIFAANPSFDSNNYLSDTTKRIHKELRCFGSGDIEVRFSFEVWRDGTPHNTLMKSLSPGAQITYNEAFSICDEMVKAAGPFRPFSF